MEIDVVYFFFGISIVKKVQLDKVIIIYLQFENVLRIGYIFVLFRLY